MASFREMSKRGAALFGAGLFLVTSVAFSFMVIWQIKKDNEQNRQNKELQAAIEQAQSQVAAQNESNQQVQAATTESSTSNESNNETKEGTKLEGTKLKDFTPQGTVSELQVIDLVEGTGAAVASNDKITAHYTGALVSDGTIFQSSLDTGKPFTSPLSNLIKGWQQGIPGMKEGGTRRLIIPAAQAYGAQSQPGIPANSDLVFDIQLIKIEK